MALNPPLPDWSQRLAWVVGASSGIGRATAAALHARGARVVVSARKAAALQAFVEQHPGAVALPLDVTDADAVRTAAGTVQALGRPDLVLYCAGHYQPLRATGFDLAQMLRHQSVNYVGALHVIDAVLPGMLAAQRGHISLVGSVAGYRGLPNSLAYGPTKAALQNLAETLWLDLRDHGIGVSLVNPGFVETPLTAGNGFHMPALITPDEAAHHMLQGWARGRFEIHFPRRFTLWLKLLRHLPHAAYFATVKRATGL
jgi:NAD(P)-dependent dehydrogenase (short-subunit alcohol dehydrogenase family)